MMGGFPLLGAAWTGWLVDSFIAFSALILLVLILRRPVARWFGPEAAYMLWALPALRWLMPPLALESLGLTSITAAFMPQTGEPLAPPPPTTAMAASDAAATAAAPAQSVIELTSLLPALWVAGAATLFVFLIRHHLKVMGQLKEDAGHLGEIGSVALYESHSTTSPLASGFWNRAIFLPQSIRHWPEETQRMAVAHEMTHHRSHHLIHNSIALALLCLNWFNPLAWAAARAFIVDQEADCDARTIAKYRFDRADYSTMLMEAAKISRTPTWTLAPTAHLIPKKALVARIRRIAMNKNDNKMRLVGYGLAFITGMALLPLTASIAQDEGAHSMEISTQPQGKSTIKISSDGRKPTYRRDINYNGKTYAFWSDRDMSDAEVRSQLASSEKARMEADKAMVAADEAMRQSEKAMTEADAAAERAEREAGKAEAAAGDAEAQAAWAEQEAARNSGHSKAAEEARQAAETARQDAEKARREAHEAWRQSERGARKVVAQARRDAHQATWEAQVEARADAIAAANEGRAIARAEAARARSEAQSIARAESIRARAEAQAAAARIGADAARNAIASVDWNGVRASVNAGVDGASATARSIRIDSHAGDSRN